MLPLKSHTIAESFLRLSNLTPPCLTEWAGMKRDCGAKRCKQSGRLRR